jgi:hypothetical protein
MIHLLASAERTDLSGSDWIIILLMLGIIAAAAVATLVPIGIARHRRLRLAGLIAVGAMLWGLAAAGSAIQTAIAEFNWSRERLRLIQTGYYDPNDTSGAPARPRVLWAALSGVYVALLVGSLAPAKPAPPTSRDLPRADN